MSFVKKIGSIRFFVEHVGGLFFDTKNYERRETRVGDKDIFLEKRIPLTLLSWLLAKSLEWCLRDISKDCKKVS